MAFARSDAKTSDHLLHEISDGQQYEQNPEQMQPVLAACLDVGGYGPGIVVGFHHDEPRAEDHEECQQAALPALAHDHTGLRDRFDFENTGYGPGIVVRFHHDEPRAEDHEECQQAALPALAHDHTGLRDRFDFENTGLGLIHDHPSLVRY